MVSYNLELLTGLQIKWSDFNTNSLSNMIIMKYSIGDIGIYCLKDSSAH